MLRWFSRPSAIFVGGALLTSVQPALLPAHARAPAETLQTVPLDVTIDLASVDLERHRLELRMSRPAGHVAIKVLAADGSTLAEDDIDFNGKPAHAALVVNWTPKSSAAVARIEVRAYDADGFFKGIAITPWSLEIPHEEVAFGTNSADITPGEVPKLEQSLDHVKKAFAAHEDLGPVTLFIVGHTDTRGSAEHNLELSRRRAHSIASWFRAHGLRMPIAYAGLGEEALKVKTADEVDEPRNRRVDYVLAVEAPRFKGSKKPVVFRKL